MKKILLAGTAALVLAGSTAVYAQHRPWFHGQMRMSAEDRAVERFRARNETRRDAAVRLRHRGDLVPAGARAAARLLARRRWLQRVDPTASWSRVLP